MDDGETHPQRTVPEREGKHDHGEKKRERARNTVFHLALNPNYRMKIMPHAISHPPPYGYSVGTGCLFT